MLVNFSKTLAISFSHCPVHAALAIAPESSCVTDRMSFLLFLVGFVVHWNSGSSGVNVNAPPLLFVVFFIGLLSDKTNPAVGHADRHGRALAWYGVVLLHKDTQSVAREVSLSQLDKKVLAICTLRLKELLFRGEDDNGKVQEQD